MSIRDSYTAVVVGGPAQEPPAECRSSYDVCADIADKFGIKDDFTEGRTHDEWIQYLYEQGAEADGNMPTWDEIKAQGVYKRTLEPVIGLEAFRTDPTANPLATPSGKIEIYSETLAEIANTSVSYTHLDVYKRQTTPYVRMHGT